MNLHPLCALFPPLSEAEAAALAEDILENGLRYDIITYDGQILDGANRYRACIATGVEPKYAEYVGDSPELYVLSANLHRRHLSPGQQAVIVASVQDWARAYGHGGDRKGERAVTLPLDTVAARQALSGASDKTQRMADAVARSDPSLAREVISGETSLPKAARKVAGKDGPVILAALAEKPAEQSDNDAEQQNRISEMSANLAELVAENEQLVRVFEADDKLKQALDECTRLRAENRVLKERLNGLMAEKNEAVRLAKSWKRKAESK